MTACRIKIYGERHTNTNYLGKLIRLNLEAEELPGVVPGPVMVLQWMLPGNEWVRDLYFRSGMGDSLGWKHTHLCPSLMARVLRAELDGMKFITLTKNPYAWLLSLYHKPYHQRFNQMPSFEEFIKRPWRTVGRDNCGHCVESPIQLWNIKNRSYLGLTPANSLRLTTEHLIKNPANIIERIASQFSVSRKQSLFVNHDECTKSTGKRYDDYRKYYLGEVWRKELSDEAIMIINQGLDRELLSIYGYDLLE